MLAQVVAERLRIPHDAIRVVRGRTDQFEYGRGAFATRLAVMAGSAAKNAADALADKAVRVAAHHFKVSTEEVDITDGAVAVVSDPSRVLTFGEIARLLEPVNAGR